MPAVLPHLDAMCVPALPPGAWPNRYPRPGWSGHMALVDMCSITQRCRAGARLARLSMSRHRRRGLICIRACSEYNCSRAYRACTRFLKPRRGTRRSPLRTCRSLRESFVSPCNLTPSRLYAELLHCAASTGIGARLSRSVSCFIIVITAPTYPTEKRRTRLLCHAHWNLGCRGTS